MTDLAYRRFTQYPKTIRIRRKIDTTAIISTVPKEIDRISSVAASAKRDVGTIVGDSEGIVDGGSEEVGISDGDKVSVVGTVVGDSEGLVDGGAEEVGISDGDTVGVIDGHIVVVGVVEGDFDGKIDGMLNVGVVGVTVGNTDGRMLVI